MGRGPLRIGITTWSRSRREQARAQGSDSFCKREATTIWPALPVTIFVLTLFKHTGRFSGDAERAKARPASVWRLYGG